MTSLSPLCEPTVQRTEPDVDAVPAESGLCVTGDGLELSQDDWGEEVTLGLGFGVGFPA